MAEFDDLDAGGSEVQDSLDSFDSAVNEVVSGGCTEKIITIDGQDLEGKTGLCFTKYPDKAIRDVEFKVTSDGDVVYIGIDTRFVNGENTKVLIRTTCRTEGCDPTLAQGPLGKILFERFGLIPQGDITVQTEQENGVVKVRAIEGSGNVNILYNDEVIGVVHAPSQSDQANGIENVAYIDGEQSVQMLQAIRSDRQYDLPGFERENTTSKTSATVGGCDTGNVKTHGVNTEPFSWMTVVLVLVAQRLKGKIKAIPSGIANATSGTRKLISKLKVGSLDEKTSDK